MVSIPFMESFDHYSTVITATDGSGIQSGGWSCGFPSDSTIIAGRYGGQALRKPQAGGREDWTRAFSPGLATFTVGFDLRCGGLNINITSIRENSGAVDHMWVSVNSSGGIEVRRGSGGTLLGASAPGVLVANAWAFLEIGGTIHDTAGVLKVWIDGIEVISATGIDTKNGGSTGLYDTFDLIESGQKDIDNLYVKDEIGSWGPLKIVSINILGDHANLGFSQLSGATLYEMVDEAKTDLDTTYISASNVNDQATFSTGGFTETDGTVRALKVSVSAKRTDGTSGRAVRCVIRDASNTSVGTFDRILSGTYAFLSNVFPLDASGNAWTIGTVNSVKIGVKVSV